MYLFTNKCPAENAGKSISEPINLKNISGGGCPQNPLVCSTYGGPTFLSARTPSKPCVTPLRVSCKSGVQNWLTTLFWCSIFFGCSTVRLTCLIYKQLLIGQVKMDSSGPISTNKQGLLRTKNFVIDTIIFVILITLAFWRSKVTAPAALARVRLSFFHDLSKNNPLCIIRNSFSNNLLI